MVYYENKDFEQTAAEKAAADLAKQNLETCKTVDGDAYFWAMFALLVIIALSVISYWAMGKYGMEQQITNPMSWTARQWVMALGGLASLAVLGMYIPMIDCRSKKLV